MVKLVPSKRAVYATARPYAVESECADTIVSNGEIAPDNGRRARVLATPAVIFSWVNDAAWSSPEGEAKKDTVNTSCGPKIGYVRLVDKHVLTLESLLGTVTCAGVSRAPCRSISEKFRSRRCPSS